ASIVRVVRDIDAAEEVVQEAFEQALSHWPAAGRPDRPGAWLLTTARRRALDHLRRRRRIGTRVDELAHLAQGAVREPPDVAEADARPAGFAGGGALSPRASPPPLPGAGPPPPPPLAGAQGGAPGTAFSRRGRG